MEVLNKNMCSWLSRQRPDTDDLFDFWGRDYETLYSWPEMKEGEPQREFYEALLWPFLSVICIFKGKGALRVVHWEGYNSDIEDLLLSI